MSDFFWSDIHFDHKNILKYSGRLEYLNIDERTEYRRLKLIGDDRMRSLKISDDSIDRMNNGIIDKINSVVKEKDTLWCGGDFYIGHSKQKLVELRNKIRCKTIHLIYGNHDQKWIKKHCPPYIFASSTDVRLLNINGQLIFISHYAHLVWPKNHRGAWHLFGHSHGNLNPIISNLLPNAKMLDIGYDGKTDAPWSLDEVQSFMNTKAGQFLDHHQP